MGIDASLLYYTDYFKKMFPHLVSDYLDLASASFRYAYTTAESDLVDNKRLLEFVARGNLDSLTDWLRDSFKMWDLAQLKSELASRELNDENTVSVLVNSYLEGYKSCIHNHMDSRG